MLTQLLFQLKILLSHSKVKFPKLEGSKWDFLNINGLFTHIDELPITMSEQLLIYWLSMSLKLIALFPMDR